MDFPAQPHLLTGTTDDQSRHHCWVVGPRHPGNGTGGPAVNVAGPGYPVRVSQGGRYLSLRYRRDGTPDCASVQQDSTDPSITRGDLRETTQQIVHSIEDLRRDIGAVRREMERTRNELENIRRETRRPPAQ